MKKMFRMPGSPTAKQMASTPERSTAKRWHSLSFKLSFQMGALFVLVLILLTVTTGVTVNRVVNQNATERVIQTAQQNASLVNDYFNGLQARGTSLASASSQRQRVDLEEGDKRLLVESMMAGVLDDERIFAVYTAWEPNTFFQDTPNGLSIYHYRDGASIRTDILNDYDVYNTGEYYAATKSTRSSHITEPYQYQLTNGQTVWLVTISSPIFSPTGEFIGLSNCDIQMDTIGSLPFKTGDYTTSYTYILSNKGVYLANTGHPEEMGKVLGEGLTSQAELKIRDQMLDIVASGKQMSTLRKSITTGEESNIVYSPIMVNGVSEPFSSVFVVSHAEAATDSRNITILMAALALGAYLLLAVCLVIFVRRALNPLKGVVAVAEDMQNGILDTDLPVKSQDEIGQLTLVFRNTATVLKNYIHEISSVLNTLASGNLRASIQQEYVGEFAPIKTALNEIIFGLNQTISHIDLAASQVNTGADQVASAAQALALSTTQQAATVEELTASLETVNQQAQQTADNTREAGRHMADTGSEIARGNSQMDELTQVMQGIHEASSRINGITKTIEDIAFQTNILALNAAVEAARAGNAGKGFAVVADEVRNLAAKSADAVQQTGDLINQSTAKVAEGLQITQKTADSLQAVSDKAAQVSDLVRQIQQASMQQAQAIEQINIGLSQVSSVVQTNAATAQESSAASEEMSAQAATLREEVRKFKLDSDLEEHPFTLPKSQNQQRQFV